MCPTVDAGLLIELVMVLAIVFFRENQAESKTILGMTAIKHYRSVLIWAKIVHGLEFFFSHGLLKITSFKGCVVYLLVMEGP